MNQILHHMGHTWDVHRDFYRQYDSVGERLDVAKLIMLQDQNKLNEYKDKSLSGIDMERLAEAQFKGKECAEYVCICRTVETLVWVHSFSPLNGVCYIFLDIVPVPQRPLPTPDTETTEEIVPDGKEFLDNPSRAEEDGAPEAMYDKPDSEDESLAVFDFQPGKFPNSSLVAQLCSNARF